MSKEFVFDAEQLSFNKLDKLDKDQITWVTIRGNHVPIPKNGSREQKARAIKEWFASKKKELPKKTGQKSVYSAKFEHEKPKIAGVTGSGEGPSVHTHGQYTLKRIDINKARYFERFAKPRMILTGRLARRDTLPDPDTMYDTSWSDIKISKIDDELIVDSIKDNGYFDQESYLKQVDKQLSEIDPKIEQREREIKEVREERAKADNPDYITLGEERLVKEKQGLEAKKAVLSTIKERLDANPNLMEEQGYKKVPANYMVKDKPVLDPKARNLLQLVWAGEISIEDAKSQAKTQTTKNALKDIESKEDIQPAKAQMSKVKIPAEKYFLDEERRIIQQPRYVKERLIDPLIASAFFYENRWSGSNVDLTKKYDVFKNSDGYKVLYEKTKELLDASLLPNEEQKKHIREDILKQLVNYREPLMGENEELLQTQKLEDPKVKWGANFNQTNWDLEKSLKQNNIENIQETQYMSEIIELLKYNGKSFYDNLKQYVGITPTRTSKILHDLGIAGSSYWGGTDKKGHVLFNVNDMETIEQTTSREVIKKWMEEQRRKAPIPKKNKENDKD